VRSETSRKIYVLLDELERVSDKVSRTARDGASIPASMQALYLQVDAQRRLLVELTEVCLADLSPMED